MKFAVIKEQLLPEFPIRVCCRVLGVTPAGFHAWRKRARSPRARRREELAVKIRAVEAEHRHVCGSPRVYKALLAGGEKVSENTVASVMKEHGIRAKGKKKFVPATTDSDHQNPVAENLLGRDFAAELPNQKWVTDITYIPTDEGFLYLAGVLDLCSRKVVGWAMADHMETSLVSEALAMAVTHRRPAEGLLHHSDRGSQYASEDYRNLLERHGMEPSMSRRGDCWDNACIESFWATLKTELVNHERFATREEARQAIFEYIAVFYNRKRLHSASGYVSPETFEASLM